jgi:hypothetical protein
MRRLLLSFVFLTVPFLLNAGFDPYQVTPDHTASMQELVWHATLKQPVASDSAVDVYQVDRRQNQNKKRPRLFSGHFKPSNGYKFVNPYSKS